MEIIIKNKKGSRLGVVSVDTKATLADAEAINQGDPIYQVGLLMRDRIELAGFEIDEEEVNRLRSLLGKATAKRNFPKLISLKGKVSRKKLSTNNQDRNSGLPSTVMQKAADVFETVFEYPNDWAQKEYSSLIGLDELKNRLIKEASLLISLDNLKKWSKKHHKKAIISACQAFQERSPLIVFGGDIGTGKTALAESFGDPIARSLKIPVYLLRISIETRGRGIVGEMTKLITKAFHEAKGVAQKTGNSVILLLDEADALAQSREATQMHHEDRAGVNALIQGIDHLKTSDTPILIVFCTNRLVAIDPAIKRRAAIIYEFTRPRKEQLVELMQKYFGDLRLTSKQISELVKLAGPNDKRPYGFTYSDIVTRLVPSAIMEAYPDEPLSFEKIVVAFDKINPTPPFNEIKAYD